MNIGQLTIREWVDIQSDIYLIEKDMKDQARRVRRAKRG